MELKLTAAIGWRMLDVERGNRIDLIELRKVRAELKLHNLYIKWDSGQRRYGNLRHPTWWLYEGSRKGSGKRRWFRGTFQGCCMEAVKRVHPER